MDGRIVEVSNDSLCSYLGGYLFFLIRSSFAPTRPGSLFPQGTGMAIWPARPRHVRKPDLTFVRNGRLPDDQPQEGWLTVVPDLVAEIVSPREKAEDLERKLLDYREAGIPLIWVIYPNSRTAQILTPGSRLEVAADGLLDGGDVLPGFQVRLTDLFAGAESDA